MRKFTRLFAIPFLILWWFLHLLQEVILLIVCICDLRPDECDWYFEDLIGIIKNFLKEGVDGV